jgi:hypothetical protein
VGGWENETCESVKWLKGTEYEDLEDELVIWNGQINAKNETATDEIITELAKVVGQKMNVTSCVNKVFVYLAPEMRSY